jgi:hypothetical protein
MKCGIHSQFTIFQHVYELGISPLPLEIVHVEVDMPGLRWKIPFLATISETHS